MHLKLPELHKETASTRLPTYKHVIFFLIIDFDPIHRPGVIGLIVRLESLQ